MKINKIVAFLLSVLFASISLFNVNAVMVSCNTYLSEQDVFEALSHTFDDDNLKTLIKQTTVFSPSGAMVKGFDSEDYSDYTNDEYGGMYLDDDGTLVLCFVENTTSLLKANTKANSVLQEALSQSLCKADGTVVAERYTIKPVKHSEKDLLIAYDFINDYACKTDVIKSAYVDVINNKIMVGVESKEDIATVSKAFNSNKSMLSFEFVEEDFMAKDIATVSGTSAINNGSVQSTPAGKLYSSELGKYGIVTCGHGWETDDNVYYGTTKIGTVKFNKTTLTNDSSFIALNSGHSYQDSLNDELVSEVPVVGSILTLRGYVSGRVTGAEVLSIYSTVWSTGGLCTGLIKCDKEMRSGDSGGGAIGRTANGTAYIVGINKCVDDSITYLVKAKTICNAY